MSFGENASIAESGGYRFFAGIRSDPFFFDLEGYQNGMKFTGTDAFLDNNVFSIILELPNSALGISSRSRDLGPGPDTQRWKPVFPDRPHGPSLG